MVLSALFEESSSQFQEHSSLETTSTSAFQKSIKWEQSVLEWVSSKRQNETENQLQLKQFYWKNQPVKKEKKKMQRLSQKYNRPTLIFVSPNTNQSSKYFQRSKTTLRKLLWKVVPYSLRQSSILKNTHLKGYLRRRIWEFSIQDWGGKATESLVRFAEPSLVPMQST